MGAASAALSRRKRGWRIADRSEAYINKVNSLIRSTEINLLDNLIRMEDDELGDSLDHVHPELKLLYTKKYYEELLKHLSPVN